MAKITRIKAKDPGKSPEKPAEDKIRHTKVKAMSSGSSDKKALEKASAAEKQPVSEENRQAITKKDSSKKAKKPFILFRPFVAFGRYVKASWHELRQVRWPSRKATWKMVLAVLVYTALFIAVIMLLDAFFTWLFGILLG